jgi:glycosyltransferase involved in cell wall biosynthesis
MTHYKYLIISPCRNEEQFMRHTLDSVVRQTVPPARWVIVDDGSTDGTPAILAEYAAQYPFIQIVTRKNRGHRSVGPGVIEAFYSGYQTVENEQFDFICKLDLDLDLPAGYFSTLLHRMEENPRIGCCSGKPYYIDATNGKMISEKCGDENAIGASKFYRKSCFLQIGGFVRQVMWDGIDGHRCRMLGWIAISWDEPALRFTHLRPMGSSQKGILTGRLRHGFGQYFMGSSFVYMTLASIYRMSRPPLFLGGLAMWWGYVKSWVTNKERLSDPVFRKFLQKYQWDCLLQGKNKATVRYNNESASRWNPERAGYPFPDMGK